MSLKDIVVQELKKQKSPQEKLNKLRENLHHLILQEVDRKGAFEQICFLGGTALRIVFGLDRFSEDLDFSTSTLSKKPFDLTQLSHSIQKSLEAFGFDCRIEKLDVNQNVKKCFFVFRHLLHEADRFFRKEQKLAIKFDADTCPPAGAEENVSLITRERIYKVRHYTLSSLFAGKLHAVLFRAYTKGRDLYDFLWYAGKKTEPNLTLLENAIFQTQNEKITLNEASLKQMLVQRFEGTDFEKAKKDAAPFLEDQDALRLFEREVFLSAARNLHVPVKK